MLALFIVSRKAHPAQLAHKDSDLTPAHQHATVQHACHACCVADHVMMQPARILQGADHLKPVCYAGQSKRDRLLKRAVVHMVLQPGLDESGQAGCTDLE